MCISKVNQHIIVLNLCNILLSKILVTAQVMTFTQSKFDAKNDNIVKSITYLICVFKNNRMFWKIKDSNDVLVNKIFKLKYKKRKLPNVCEHKWVRFTFNCFY